MPMGIHLLLEQVAQPAKEPPITCAWSSPWAWQLLQVAMALCPWLSPPLGWAAIPLGLPLKGSLQPSQTCRPPHHPVQSPDQILLLASALWLRTSAGCTDWGWGWWLQSVWLHLCWLWWGPCLKAGKDTHSASEVTCSLTAVKQTSLNISWWSHTWYLSYMRWSLWSWKDCLVAVAQPKKRDSWV